MTFDEAVSFALRAIRKGLKLKPEQPQAICHVYDRKDVFLLLPTEFVCYQMLPLCSTTRNEAVLAVVLLTVV